jgi:hypothetical protein
MDLDMTESLAPKSDQLDAIDLVSGPRTFTIEKVSRHNTEQPFNFHLAEFDRVWRPGKSMRRVIAAAWGVDASKYSGQRVTLFCDPSVQFGNDVTGGTRISHMTGIDKPLKVPLLVKRGKSALFTVQPLKEAPKPAQPTTPARDWTAEAAALNGDTDGLRALYMDAQAAGATPETLAHIKEQATT